MRRSYAYTSLLLAGILSLSACGSVSQPPPIPPLRAFTDPALKEQADREFMVYDPAEGMNKQIYKFNAEFDDYFFLPVVNTYTFITPKLVRTGVSNFFLNVAEVNNFANALLQINPKKASITLFRFAINSTAGLLGTVDVARKIGLNRQQEDFGKTLAHWGASNGAYIILPLLGPSNVRDTLGKIVDYGTFAFIIPEHVQNSPPYEAVAYGLRGVDLRYSDNFRYYSSGSPFEYELVRYISAQLRAAEIEQEKEK